MKTHSASELQ